MAPTNKLYIPRVYIPAFFGSPAWIEKANKVKLRIGKLLSFLEIADVDTIEIKPHKHSNKPYSMAFVHIKNWHETEAASSIVSRLKDHGSAKIVYDDPHYWLLLPWQSKEMRTNRIQTNTGQLENRISSLEQMFQHKIQLLENKITEIMAKLADQCNEEAVNTNGKRVRINSEE